MTFPKKTDALAAGAALAGSAALAFLFASGGRREAAFSVSACAGLVLPALAAGGVKPRTLGALLLGAMLPAILFSLGEGLKGAAVAGAATVLWAGLYALASPVLRGSAGGLLTPLNLAAYAAPFWVKHVGPWLTWPAFRLSPFAVLASGSNAFDLRTHGMMYSLGPGTDYAYSMPSFWFWVLAWALLGGAFYALNRRSIRCRLRRSEPHG